MDKETKKAIAILSIAFVAMLVVFLVVSGFDIQGIRIHRGIHINIR